MNGDFPHASMIHPWDPRNFTQNFLKTSSVESREQSLILIDPASFLGCGGPPKSPTSPSSRFFPTPPLLYTIHTSLRVKHCV